jgi:uncharacterized protein YabN with tetrapyrrole methylase and pyrophosphatase domain
MLTLIGLGSGELEGNGSPAGLSLGAWDALRRSSSPRLARRRGHPALAWLESSEGDIVFDAAFESLSDREAADRVLTLARLGDVAYVVPGHPLLGDPSALIVTETAQREGIPLRVYSPAALPTDSPADFDALTAVMARLRDPVSGCPWDREQTPQTLRKYVIEEAYEVVEAIDSGDPRKLT